MNSNFKGIYAATVVPIFKNKKIDFESLIKHNYDISTRKGIKGLLINGHAGENFYFNYKEQIKITEKIRENTPKDKFIVSGINFEDSYTAASVSKDMISAGADAIMVFPPNSWALSLDDNIVYNHHKIISSKIKKPLMLYQASIYAGKMSYSLNILKKLIDIDGVIGIKEGSWNFNAYKKNYDFIKKNKPSFLVMASGDEHLYSCFKYGSDGSLVSLAILIPELITYLYENIKNEKSINLKSVNKKINTLAKLIYGVPPQAFATARLKVCLRLLKKIRNNFVKSPMSQISNIETLKLKKALIQADLKF